MQILVTYVSVGRQGQVQRDQRRVDGAVLGVGRGTHCEIHLADARVALNHARITVTAAGATIEAQSGSVEVNGHAAAAAALAVGDRIEIGPYEMVVEAPPGGLPLALSVKLGRPLPVRGISLRRALARRPPVSKRRLSYIAFLSVLLLCLLIPMTSDLLDQWHGAHAVPPSGSEMSQDVLHAMSGKFTKVWNPGPVSRSHQIFGSDCRACHEYPFVQVRDGACLACHKEIKEHVARTQLTGQQGLSFAEARCAECHRDHKGIQMAPRAQEQCADCHRNIKAFAAKAGSDNVTDFRVDHPAFRLSMLDAAAPGVVRRVRQGGKGSAALVENSNLKFNHALHMDRAGVRSPGSEKRTVLECSSCHQPVDGGRLMAPISMEKHCQECHSLAFEPKLTQRQVPHGSEKAIATMLREFYARLVLGDAAPGVPAPEDVQRRRPGAVLTTSDRQQALRIADERAQRALRDLFETREVCKTCHDVSRDGSGWKVAPVAVTSHWMPQARFTHGKHTAQSCTTCHDVTKSKESRDVGMPDIGKCRECHVGARAVMDKVTSDCTTCHRFHAGRDRWHGPASLTSQREARSRK
ncbi:MAG TPA: cytochrome c3 family protein [Burkholderiales bacterium]|nr:cytochrome c3 family protein [Burkholderiales bacterium]